MQLLASRTPWICSAGGTLALLSMLLCVGQAEATRETDPGLLSYLNATYLRSLGKSLIWPDRFRPIEHPPSCGREIDGPELPAFIAFVGGLLGLGWMSRKARVIICSIFGGVSGVYMSLLAFHIVTMDEAPYKGDLWFCAELFLFLLVPFLPAAFFSVMVRGGSLQGQTAKTMAACVLGSLSMMLFMSVTIGHEADHAADHRIWWLVAAQFLIPMWILGSTILFVLRLMGFRARDKETSPKGARGARVASIQRVLAGHPVTLHETKEAQGKDIPVASTRSQQRRSSLTRTLRLEHGNTEAKKKTRRSKSPVKRRESPGKKSASSNDDPPDRRVTRGSAKGKK